MSGPLSGYRIVEIAGIGPGPFAAMMLSDMGAEVIRVERTQAVQEGAGPNLDLLQRNRKSIAIDLKSDAGREAFLRLVEKADVVLEGFRPGVMDRLGVGYETLRKANPGLVYCAISGYGQDGPYRDRAGHDINYLGSTGLLEMTGQKGGPPIQPAAQIGDIGGGAMTAAFGVMTALFGKQRTGKGQMVDISMTDGAMSWAAMTAGAYFADGTVQKRGEAMLGGGVVCYLPYEAKDGGWVSCGALEPKFWKRFCEGVDARHLAEHQFDPPGGPGWTKVAEVFKAKTRAEWKAFNDEHDCCIEPILDLGEAMDSELAEERGMVVEWEQPGLGKVREVGNPVKLSETPAAAPRPAPAGGADTVDVLTEAGFSAEEIEALLESGAAAGTGGNSSADTEFRA